MSEYRIQRRVECTDAGCRGGQCQTSGVWETLEGTVRRGSNERVEDVSPFYTFVDDDDADFFLLQ